MDSGQVLAQRLAQLPTWGYAAQGPDAAEPVALATLALTAAGDFSAARRGATTLARMQASTGAVGPFAGEDTPSWPTAWAVLAWRTLVRRSGDGSYSSQVARGLRWILANRSHTQPRPQPSSHDTTLAGWPWAEGTHGWVEPTAMHVLALKSCGLGRHARTREAVRLLLDRQLPGGGCNYGNTFVLDAKLLPHVQPTGMALWALYDEPADPRVTQSLRYLQREWPHIQGTTSRCFAALGLSAHGCRPPGPIAPPDGSASRAAVSRPLGAYPLALQLLVQLPLCDWLDSSGEAA